MAGDPDPLSNRYDLGNDPIVFAEQRAKVIQGLIPKLIDRFTANDAGYDRVRHAFGVLLGAHGQANFFAARLVGGLYSSRSHRDDPRAQPPFRVVQATQQRKAMELLSEQIFSDKSYQFPPEFYNQLVSTRWLHWGSDNVDRQDYPVHEAVLKWQQRILQQLLDARTLTRLADNTMKVGAKEDRFTTSELLRQLVDSIYSEIFEFKGAKFTDQKPAISSLRRNLQREALGELLRLALGGGIRSGTSVTRLGSSLGIPPDARSLANFHMKRLLEKVTAVLSEKPKQGEKMGLDDASRAHLEDVQRRIQAVLDVEIMVSSP